MEKRINRIYVMLISKVDY